MDGALDEVMVILNVMRQRNDEYAMLMREIEDIQRQKK